jgi:putative ABC transport system permease protein
MFFKLVWKKLWHRRLNSLLCILLMAFGVALISIISITGKQLEKQFSGNISGIDMVLGAKGSPLQLILSAVFHIDAPTGNISLDEASHYEHHPMVKKYIPLSYGDNFQGFRIVGTDQRFLDFYNSNSKTAFPKAMEALLGYETAKASGLKTNDTFESSHGLDKAGEKHGDSVYKVIGVLPKTGTVTDKLILTNLESVWHIHEEHDHETDHNHENDSREITAALVKFKSPIGILTLPKQINENTTMQAALPPIEINRLLSLFDSAIQLTRYLAYVIVLISGISVFISLYNSLKDHRNEKALMMSLGAHKWKVFLLMLCEGFFLSTIGFITGITSGRLILFVLQKTISNPYLSQIEIMKYDSTEIYLFVMTLVVGILSAALPASGVFRINIAQTLVKD